MPSYSVIVLLYTHADQQAKVIGVSVGSTCGGLILIAILVILIVITLCVTMKKRKRTSFEFSTNVAYYKGNITPKEFNSVIVTEENTAYETVLTLSTANKVDVEYESFHDSISIEFDSETKKSRSSRQVSLALTMHDNIAYQPTSMISNIAYGSFHKIM